VREPASDEAWHHMGLRGAPGGPARPVIESIRETTPGNRHSTRVQGNGLRRTGHLHTGATDGGLTCGMTRSSGKYDASVMPEPRTWTTIPIASSRMQEVDRSGRNIKSFPSRKRQDLGRHPQRGPRSSPDRSSSVIPAGADRSLPDAMGAGHAGSLGGSRTAQRKWRFRPWRNRGRHTIHGIEPLNANEQLAERGDVKVPIVDEASGKRHEIALPGGV